jgi:hypothetical protein
MEQGGLWGAVSQGCLRGCLRGCLGGVSGVSRGCLGGVSGVSQGAAVSGMCLLGELPAAANLVKL